MYIWKYDAFFSRKVESGIFYVKHTVESSVGNWDSSTSFLWGVGWGQHAENTL